MTEQALPLQRHLKLFGTTFQVQTETGLTFCPDTVLSSALDVSILQMLREHPKNLDLVLRGFLRAATGRSRPRAEMRKSVSQVLGAFVPPDVLEAALEGKDLTAGMAWQSNWECVEKGLGEPSDGWLYQLVARLAKIDRVAWSARQLHNQQKKAEAEALISQQIGHPLERWRALNPGLFPSAAVLVDIALQTLVWLEGRYPPQDAPPMPEKPESVLLPLLATGRKPLGHWLVRIQSAAGCTNLQKLSSLLLRKEVKRHQFHISHGLLKKWSSGAQLMPRQAAKEVLAAVAGRVNPDQELSYFAVARFLSFLCDFVVAGSQGEAPSWANVQQQIHTRYQELSGPSAVNQ